MNQHYLDMANKNMPELYESTLTSERTVRLIKSSGFYMGVGTADAEPVKAELKDGDKFIIDFGKHTVGRFSLRVTRVDKYLDAPVRLKLRFAEVPFELSRDFSTYKPGLCPSWLQEEIVNIDEEGFFCLPRRYAFRYAEVEVVYTPRKLKLSDFTVTAVTSAHISKLKPLPENTDSILKKIDSVACATLKDCMQSAYEDGPKRDRRLWSGDLRLQALTDYYLFRNSKLARRCLYLFAACETSGRYLPGCIYQSPAVFCDSDMGITDYAMHWCSSLCDYFQHTGDVETTVDLFPVLVRQINLAVSLLDENGVLTYLDGWNKFIDWAPGLKSSVAVHGVFLYTLENCVRLAKALGKTDLSREWERVLIKNRKEAYEAYYDSENNRFISSYNDFQYSVQTEVWVILGGVVCGDEAKALLVNALNSTESIKPVTPFMHHYVLEAFCKLNMFAEMKDHIIKYWGGMVMTGADTFWETYTPDNKDFSVYSDSLMTSFCHAWSCSPSYFIRKYCV